MTDTLVTLDDVIYKPHTGGTLKMTGINRMQGHLVRFGKANTDEDLDGEFFDAATYFMRNAGYPIKGAPINYQHGFSKAIGNIGIGIFDLVDEDEIGIFVEGELYTRVQYLEMLREYARAKSLVVSDDEFNKRAELAEKKVQRLLSEVPMQQSMGADPTTWKVDYSSGHIEQAGIIHGALTPTPADDKNPLVQFKSAWDYILDLPHARRTFDMSASGTPNLNIDSEHDIPEARSEGDMPTSAVDDVRTDDSNTQPTKKVEVITMAEQDVASDVQETPQNNEDKSPPNDALKGLDDRFSNLASKLEAIEAKTSERFDTILDYIEKEPRINRSGYVTVDGGMADKNIKNATDMLLSLKRRDYKRLLEHYGLKLQSTDDGTTGGVYVPEAVLQELLPGLNLASGIGQLVTRVPVDAPSGEMPIRDYSRTPTADAGNTASAQGIESQAREEGGAYTEETMYFEMLQYRTTDATSGFIDATIELHRNWTSLPQLLRNGIEEDVANKEEFFILRGTGVGQPHGVLNWSGTVGVNEDTDNTFVVADADEMLSRLMSVRPERTAWVHHPSIITSIAAFERGTGGSVYQPDIKGALPESLHGYMRFNSQHLPQIGTNGYTLLGDWSRYFLFEYGGLYIDFSEHAEFKNGKVTWRFGKHMDGKPALTSAVTLADGSFTVSPFVAINNLS